MLPGTVWWMAPWFWLSLGSLLHTAQQKELFALTRPLPWLTELFQLLYHYTFTLLRFFFLFVFSWFSFNFSSGVGMEVWGHWLWSWVGIGLQEQLISFCSAHGQECAAATSCGRAEQRRGLSPDLPASLAKQLPRGTEMTLSWPACVPWRKNQWTLALRPLFFPFF